jgi:hypothetical protein
MPEDQLCQLEDTVSRYPGGMTDNCIVKELLLTIRGLQAQIAPPEPPPHNCSGCAHWHRDPLVFLGDMRLCQVQTTDGMRYVLTNKESVCPRWKAIDG